MAPHHLLSFFSLVLAGCYATTSRLESRNDRYLKLPVVHATNRDVFGDVWSQKRDTATVSLANRSDVAYYAQLDIGNPPQPQFVQLDTGSFELWVNPDCSNLDGASDQRFCNAVGNYNPSASSTSEVLAGTKTLVYGIGSANIQYVRDDITLSGTDANLEGVQFGVATSTKDEFSGILGIGHGEGLTLEYKNFIDELEEQDITDTKAFSIALGSKLEQEGVIIFGGLDTGKFSGTLTTLPIIPPVDSPDGVPRYWINMDHISLTPPSGDAKQYDNTTLAVFVDSGATLTLLPPSIANTIAADFGADGIDEAGMYPIDCALNDVPGTLDFAFDGITIRVPYYELVREFQTSLGELCYLGIGPHDEFVLLGDTMLRSTYAVFDQTNEALYFAQYVNCDTNELEITTDLDIGSVTGDCDPPDFNTPSSTTGTFPNVPAVAGDRAAGDNSNAGSTSRPDSLLGLWIVLAVILADLITQGIVG